MKPSHLLLRRTLLAATFFLRLAAPLAHAGDNSVYQWSVPTNPDATARAFLWIPPDCQRVRAVVVGQNNMIEQGILAHPILRTELARLGIAEVWVAPPFDGVFRFDQGAGERFDAMMQALAHESGYAELARAPIIPLGHSACASYPWNFAAWNPARTLAILSVHGDAPLTTLSGSGHPNPAWGDRSIDGVPGVMIMAEYEWGNDRLEPALAYRRAHPQAPIAMLAEPGRGHFDYSDDLIKFLAMFIRKSAESRLPADPPLDQSPVLKPVDPAKGWLVERWHLNQPRHIVPAPVDKYTGDPKEAFWAFDQECAEAIQNYRANQVGKKPQLLGFVQDGKVIPQTSSAEQIRLPFEPDADGLTFHLRTAFLDRVESGSPNLPRWTGLPVGTPLGHAAGGATITVSRIVGPVSKVDDGTFIVSLDRMASTTDRRADDLWFFANQEGDGEYRSAVQQALIKLPHNTEGASQTISFPAIPDQTPGTETVPLAAVSDALAPVSYYVREGPAEIDHGTLRLTKIPPRSRSPIKVTVVAWQLGRSSEPKLKAAVPVERAFFIRMK